MAKRKYGINEVKAITQADLLQKNMSDAELRTLVRDASAIANERIRRLEKSGMSEFSRAYHSNVREKHGRFGVRGKVKRAQLTNEFKAIKSFLEMKTSTPSGTKAVRNKVNERLDLTFSSAQREKSFWRTYRKLEERGKLQGITDGSPQVIVRLHQIQSSNKEYKNLLRDINRMNSDLSDEEIEDFVSRNILIEEDGTETKIGRKQDDFIHLMEIETERLFRQGRGATKSEKQYNHPRPTRH